VALLAAVDGRAADKEYVVKGMVVSVRPSAKSFVVSHEPIAGLMDAMTMPFEVRQAAELRDLVPGAIVEFTLVVGDSTTAPACWLPTSKATSSRPNSSAIWCRPRFGARHSPGRVAARSCSEIAQFALTQAGVRVIFGFPSRT
jgi:Cu/Ag efflux protein CusF